MAGIAQLGGLTSGVTGVPFEAQYQAQVLAKETAVVRDLGTAALNLIRAVVTAADPSSGQTLDVKA